MKTCRLTRWAWAVAWFACLAGSAAAADSGSAQTIDKRLYHLGTPGEPEWQSFVGKTPYGRQLDIHFNAQANPDEATLRLRQDDVKLDWRVTINGHRVGYLFLIEAPVANALAIPPRVLRDGDNVLSIQPPDEIDDIIVGDFQLDYRPLKAALKEATVIVNVMDADGQTNLPCRITIVDREGALAAVYAEPSLNLAIRPGVVYTGNGQAELGLPAGEYTIYATRGFEYGVASQKLTLAAGDSRPAYLQIRRETPTSGLASCDTHIHTFSYSQHGDASIQERVVTLAGEGIELPVATDHNCLTDYSPVAREGDVASFFTPVIGSEITTPTGHFNIFPVQAGSAIPDFRVQDWPQLMRSLRATPGVRVVVLNHPRNLHNNFRPFAAPNFNPVTGDNRRGADFSFDAIEVVNSSALQSDLMLNFQDWFALLNHGYRITALGASDAHDVSRYIVGQGRSYVVCDDSHPAKINVEEACRNILKGRVLVSLGLLTQMTVNDEFTVGDLATGMGDTMKVAVTVLGPSWTHADRVELFANGIKIREQAIDPAASSALGEKARVVWDIHRPAHDLYLVALASGPAVTAPYWPIARPYQPTSRVWAPRVLGATNPIWIDADGDGKFTSARAYAQSVFKKVGADTTAFINELAGYDQAVAAQAAGLCQAAHRDVRSAAFEEALKTAPAAVQAGFADFAETLPPR